MDKTTHFNKKWAVFGIVAIIFVLAGLYLFDGYQKIINPISTSDFVMDTVVTQQVYGLKSEEAAAEVVTRMMEYEKICSYYIDSSQLSLINQNAGKSYVQVDSQLFELIKLSKQYARETNGLFDITVAPLVSLWGVTTENPRVPDADEIDAALKLIDYNDILLKEDTLEVMLAREGMKIDLGGIAKGYICTVARQVYKEYGIKAAWISIGGNIYTYGEKPDGSLYTIGVSAPVDNRQELLGRVVIGEYVIASSGGYERYFEQDGKTYHHIIDPTDGYPADNGLLSLLSLQQTRSGGYHSSAH